MAIFLTPGSLASVSHTRHWLVEHDQGRVGHQGTSHLEQLALPSREGCGKVIFFSVELEALEKLHGLDLDVRVLLLPEPWEQGPKDAFTALTLGTELHVLDYGQEAKRLCQLEGADLAHLGNLE